MSRITKIIIGTVAVLLIGLLIYLFFLRGKGGDSGIGGVGGFFGGGGSLPNTGSGGGGGGTNGDGSGGGQHVEGSTPSGGTIAVSPEEGKKLVQLSKDPVIGHTVREKDNAVLFFKRGVGHLFQTDFDGKNGETRLSNLTITDVVSVRWSPSRSYAFLTALDGDSVKNYWLHITSTSTIESGIFQNAIVSAEFSPVEERLASLIRVNETYSLYTSNPDGTKAKTILSTKVQDFEVSWITKDLIALKTRASAFIPSLLELVSTLNSDQNVLSSDQRGFDILWSPDGSEYLSTGVNESGHPFLFTKNRTTLDKTILSSLTLPEKCVYSKKTRGIIYCALPADQNGIRSMNLPDDWWQGKVQFQDQIWKFDLTKEGTAELVFEGGGFDIINPLLSPNENYLLFVNKRDSALWSYRLL